MPDRHEFTPTPPSPPPPWNEADSIRETTLLVVDDPADREALRQAGRLLYNLAVETTHLPGDESGDSITGAELRAAAAELRFMEGYLAMFGRSRKESSLTGEDEALARFACKLARKVGALAERIEGKLLGAPAQGGE